MKDHSRRSFVKTSAATGLTFTFAGLIRAHGQSGGGTTWNPEVTFGSTFGTDVSTTWNHEATYVATTWPGNNYSTTWDPNGSYGETTNPYQEYTTTYDPNVYETTQPEAEIQTTVAYYVEGIPKKDDTIDTEEEGYSESELIIFLSSGYAKVKYWIDPISGEGNPVKVSAKLELRLPNNETFTTLPKITLEGACHPFESNHNYDEPIYLEQIYTETENNHGVTMITEYKCLFVLTLSEISTPTSTTLSGESLFTLTIIKRTVISNDEGTTVNNDEVELLSSARSVELKVWEVQGS